jgi:hypothetical protein
MTRKLVNDWGHLGILVTERYGREVVGWEFKSELDLLLLMLCEDTKLSWLYGSRKIVNTQTKF